MTIARSSCHAAEPKMPWSCPRLSSGSKTTDAQQSKKVERDPGNAMFRNLGCAMCNWIIYIYWYIYCIYLWDHLESLLNPSRAIKKLKSLWPKDLKLHGMLEVQGRHLVASDLDTRWICQLEGHRHLAGPESKAHHMDGRSKITPVWNKHKSTTKLAEPIKKIWWVDLWEHQF